MLGANSKAFAIPSLPNLLAQACAQRVRCPSSSWRPEPFRPSTGLQSMYRTIVTLPVVCLSALQPVFPLIYGRSKRTKQGRDGTVILVKIYKGVRLVCDFRVRRGFSHGVVMTCASSRGNYVGRPIGTTAKLVVRQNTTWPPWKTSRLRNTRALGVGKVH